MISTEQIIVIPGFTSEIAQTEQLSCFLSSQQSQPGHTGQLSGRYLSSSRRPLSHYGADTGGDFTPLLRSAPLQLRLCCQIAVHYMLCKQLIFSGNLGKLVNIYIPTYQAHHDWNRVPHPHTIYLVDQ